MGSKLAQTITMFFGAIVVLLICFGLFGWLVQILWNECLVPAVTVCRPISFFQSIGLICLMHLLARLAALDIKNQTKKEQ